MGRTLKSNPGPFKGIRGRSSLVVKGVSICIYMNYTKNLNFSQAVGSDPEPLDHKRADSSSFCTGSKASKNENMAPDNPLCGNPESSLYWYVDPWGTRFARWGLMKPPRFWDILGCCYESLVLQVCKHYLLGSLKYRNLRALWSPRNMAATFIWTPSVRLSCSSCTATWNCFAVSERSSSRLLPERPIWLK